MKTNFQMIRELNKKYNPQEKGFVSKEEIVLIKDMLSLEEMDILQLRNLRDFTVLYFSSFKEKEIDSLDKMSAITAVIDNEIFNKGGEV